MRLILFIILFSAFFGCGGGKDAPLPESENKDCEITGIGEEVRDTLLIRSRAELEALHKQSCQNYRGVIDLALFDGIENLKGLQNLRKVAGLSIVQLSDLQNLDGIEALEITGTRSLLISGNPKLTSIAALNAPKVLALPPDDYRQNIWLSIIHNPKLESQGLRKPPNFNQRSS